MVESSFVVLVPVKPPSVGKSRLRALRDDVRRELAAAFAIDTVSACLATRSVSAVLAVTDDAFFSRELAAAGCVAMPDGVADDLNGTLRQAAAEARRRWPELVPVALCADLPSLRPEDLDAALSQAGLLAAAGQASYVADAAGLGTTLYAAPYVAFDPRFGPGSAGAHDDSGATPLSGELATLRRDVDDLPALEEARRLGLGPHTRERAAPLWEDGPPEG